MWSGKIGLHKLQFNSFEKGHTVKEKQWNVELRPYIDILTLIYYFNSHEVRTGFSHIFWKGTKSLLSISSRCEICTKLIVP